MPNPAGGKGLYVIELPAAGNLFTLTIHDRLLLERLAALPSITPGTIRSAVRELATEGAAGRAAKRAAEAAEREELTSRAMIEFSLVNRLLKLAKVGEVNWRLLCEGDKAFRQYLRSRLVDVAPRFGITADELLMVFEQVGEAAAAVGVASPDRPSLNERRIQRLAAFMASVGSWTGAAAGSPDDPGSGVVRCAERTLRDACQAQELARALIEDALSLVRAWRVNAGAVRERFSRPEWLLDGWQQACAMWEAVMREQRPVQRDALEQIRLLIPFLDPDPPPQPAQVTEERVDRSRRVRVNQDWRTGLTRTIDTARNESLRAALL